MNIIKTIKNTAVAGLKMPLVKVLFSGILVGLCLGGVLIPQATVADAEHLKDASYVAKLALEEKRVVKTVQVKITAYSSTPDQTDDTPFITASQKHVADGIVANNGLPFGTKIRIPALYGDKVFVVEDRMHRRKGDFQVDIWMPDRGSALQFGVKHAEIEVLEN